MLRVGVLNILILITAIVVHAGLCLGPAYQRGYPPMDPYMEYIAPFVSIVIIILAAPLNRTLSSNEIWVRRICFALVYSIGLGGAFQYRVFGHARPNHGPYLSETLIIAAVVLIPTIITIKVVDRIVNRVLTRKRSGNYARGESMDDDPITQHD